MIKQLYIEFPNAHVEGEIIKINYSYMAAYESREVADKKRLVRVYADGRHFDLDFKSVEEFESYVEICVNRFVEKLKKETGDFLREIEPGDSWKYGPVDDEDDEDDDDNAPGWM